jgi:hypothetical protein
VECFVAATLQETGCLEKKSTVPFSDMVGWIVARVIMLSWGWRDLTPYRTIPCQNLLFLLFLLQILQSGLSLLSLQGLSGN